MSNINIQSILTELNAETSNYVFRPVQTTESAIEKHKTAQNGFVYFTTDSRKIYLGHNDDYVAMGGNSGIYYGLKQIEQDNSGVAPDPKVSFIWPDEIEGDTIPQVDDLILNTDGCFYRVKDFSDDNTIETTRLTLQGSGNNSGPVGPGGGNISLVFVGNKNKVIASTTDTIPISFKGYYSGTDENHIASVSFYIKGQDEPFYTVEDNLPFNQEHTIDLINYIHLFSTSKLSLALAIKDIYEVERSVDFSIQIMELSLTATEKTLFSSSSNSYTYNCDLAGATANVKDKKIVYKFYSENNLNTPIYTQEKVMGSITDEGNIQTVLNLNQLEHGIYTMTVQAFAKLTETNTLSSNILSHKVIRFDPEIRTPLLAIFIPEKTEQYTNIPVDYLLVTNEASANYTLSISIPNTNLDKNIVITTNIFDSYDLYFETTGNYLIDFSITDLDLNYITHVNIDPYSGTLPFIDSTRDDLMLYLNPKGKSNNDLDRNYWMDYNGKYEGIIKNSTFSKIGGWITDEDGTSCLSLVSGASFEIPNFLPFEYDPTLKDVNNSSMGYGMTIELDFEISGVLDYDTELIKCISTTQSGDIQCGFAITGERIKFYNSRLNGGIVGPLMDLSIIENKRIKFSFVIEPNDTKKTDDYPMCFAYLDGILSGAVFYKDGDSYKDAVNPAKLIINSTDAQIKIYGIRFYSSSLSTKVILNNYEASLPTLAQRQEKFETNNVLNSDGKTISYAKVSADDYNLQIPFMKITGGWSTQKNDKWRLKSASDANVGLPTSKKDYRLIDVEVKYPKNAYFKDYNDYSFINTFSDNKTMAESYEERPTNGGCIMYCQGTSSMEYPIKNLRLRWKNDEDFYKVRPELAPVEIICMKADYMDSSGSHNTGAANFIDNLYSEMGFKTPGQRQFDREGNKIVTCIKGHPCLIFYSETGAPGSYYYIGKYNLNLDKATPEPFGFNHDDSNFGYLSPGDKYYEVLYAEKDDDYKDPFVGQLKPTDGADYVPGQVETEKTVESEKTVNSIHCFEFLDNAVDVCNFLNKDGYTYEETWYNTFTNKDNEEVPGWTLGFESRYPEDRVGYHDADMLYPLAAWLHELYNIKTIQKNPERANKRFAAEYQCYLDKNFLLFYYLVTEALLMADSRVKNMMIATWGKEKRTYVDIDTKETKETYNYIFYPIFYDMDTMLGLDNTGVFRFNYYDEDTNESIYNGKDVLWNFVRDALSADLKTYYNELEEALLSANDILPYFNLNQANMANEAFYNGDADYKYVIPAREGYDDLLNEEHIDPGVGPYLYACQGNRSLMREWFITNRIKYLRGKYNSADYKSKDLIEFRWYYPDGVPDEFIGHEKSLTEVPPSDTFVFDSLKTGYSGVMLGKNGVVVNSKFNGEDTQSIVLTEAKNANGTEAYILGLSNLSNVGDLSNKYVQKFVIDSSDVRLKTLILGNPNKYYYNPYWKQEIGLSGCNYLQNFNLQNCSTYNHMLDFSNCPAIETVLLTGSNTSGVILPANGLLKELRLPLSTKAIKIDSHSGLTAENFSLGTYNYGPSETIGVDGSYQNDYSRVNSLYVVNTPIDTYSIATTSVDLAEYYLHGFNWNITENDTQYCIRQIKVISVNNLTPIIFSDPNCKYSYLPNIYFKYNDENNKYELSTSASYENDVSYYQLISNNIVAADKRQNYFYAVPYGNSNDDYDYYTFKEGKIQLISLEDYYRYRDGNYIPFVREPIFNESTNKTELEPIPNLYEKFTLVVDNKITNIPVLEYLMTKSHIDCTKHADALKGTIVIDISGVEVSEFDIYQKYHSIYPNVDILYSNNTAVIRASKIEFYNQENITENSLPYYSVLANGVDNLASLISEYGPNGLALTAPKKAQTTENIYRFTGIWKNVLENNKEYNENEFINIIPSGDNMKFVPIFEELVRPYEIILYNYDGSELINTTVGYDSIIADALTKQGYSTHKFIYRSDDISDYERWSLKGWISDKDYNNHTENPVVYDLSTKKMSGKFIGYAYMKKEDVRYVASDANYFNYIYNTERKGYLISLKEDLINVLQGKITLPLKTPSNQEIIGVDRNGFKDITKITHIFFEYPAEGQKSTYKVINYKGFAFDLKDTQPSLVTIELPLSIESIEEQSFYRQYSLINVLNFEDCAITTIGKSAFSGANESSDSNLGISFNGTSGYMATNISKLPSTLLKIDSSAFWKNYGITISELPDKVQFIGDMAFSRAPNVAIANFGMGESQLTTIGSNAFRLAGINLTGVADEIIVSFGPNLSQVDISAFRESYLSHPTGEDDLKGITSSIRIYNAELYNKLEANNKAFTDVYAPDLQFVGVSSEEVV